MCEEKKQKITNIYTAIFATDLLSLFFIVIGILNHVIIFNFAKKIRLVSVGTVK